MNIKQLTNIVEYIDDAETFLQNIKIIEHFIELVCDADIQLEKRERHERHITELFQDVESIIWNMNLYITIE
jgi:oligoendopeptidase F